MERIRIEHETGWMELNIESFFFWNEKLRKHWMAEYRKADTLRKRVLKNIEVLKKSEKN